MKTDARQDDRAAALPDAAATALCMAAGMTPAAGMAAAAARCAGSGLAAVAGSVGAAADTCTAPTAAPVHAAIADHAATGAAKGGVATAATATGGVATVGAAAAATGASATACIAAAARTDVIARPVAATPASRRVSLLQHRAALRAASSQAALRARWRGALPLLLALAAAFIAGPVFAMQPLADADLSAVRGRDGVSFDLNGFAMNGDVRVTYTAPSGNSIYKANLSASRSDSSDAFADPYRIDIVPGASGLADVMQLSFPSNGSGEQRWQFAYDWGVQANGVARDNGAVVYNDLVLRGGGLQFSTPQSVDGIAWGAALRLDIGQLSFRPLSRFDTLGQMALSNIQIGAVDANGNFTGEPWQLAHVASQPGILNALNDDSGPRLHIGIDWPDSRYGDGTAPTGGIAIGNISFNNPSGGNVDLGSSRIGSVQIQYLDVKFRR